MENLKYTNLENIREFLKLIGYHWSGEMVDNNIIKIALIEDFQNTICLKLNKENKIEFLRVDVNDFNFYLENKSLNQKYNFNDYSTMWQALMIQNTDADYANILYRKTLQAKQTAEKAHNEKIKLTQKLLEHLQYEKSLEIAKYNTTIYNAKHKLNKTDNKKIKDNTKTM